jgi:hypothetical protein
MAYVRTKEHRELMSKIKKGSKHSEETKEKMRKPKTLTPKFLDAQTKRGMKKRNEKHPNWKGDKVGYTGLHEWVRKRKIKPKFCEGCGLNKPLLDLANISKKYKRDVNDFKWLCKKCHYHFDRG